MQHRMGIKQVRPALPSLGVSSLDSTASRKRRGLFYGVWIAKLPPMLLFRGERQRDEQFRRHSHQPRHERRQVVCQRLEAFRSLEGALVHVEPAVDLDLDRM